MLQNNTLWKLTVSFDFGFSCFIRWEVRFFIVLSSLFAPPDRSPFDVAILFGVFDTSISFLTFFTSIFALSFTSLSVSNPGGNWGKLKRTFRILNDSIYKGSSTLSSSCPPKSTSSFQLVFYFCKQSTNPPSGLRKGEFNLLLVAQLELGVLVDFCSPDVQLPSSFSFGDFPPLASSWQSCCFEFSWANDNSMLLTFERISFMASKITPKFYTNKITTKKAKSCFWLITVEYIFSYCISI